MDVEAFATVQSLIGASWFSRTGVVKGLLLRLDDVCCRVTAVGWLGEGRHVHGGSRVNAGLFVAVQFAGQRLGASVIVMGSMVWGEEC